MLYPNELQAQSFSMYFSASLPMSRPSYSFVSYSFLGILAELQSFLENPAQTYNAVALLPVWAFVTPCGLYTHPMLYPNELQAP